MTLACVSCRCAAAGISGLGAFSRHQTALVHRFLDIIEHVPSTPAALAALSDGKSTSSDTPASKPAEKGAQYINGTLRHGRCVAVSPAPSASDLSFLSDLFLDILLVPNAAKLPRPQAPNGRHAHNPCPFRSCQVRNCSCQVSSCGGLFGERPLFV